MKTNFKQTPLYQSHKYILEEFNVSLDKFYVVRHTLGFSRMFYKEEFDKRAAELHKEFEDFDDVLNHIFLCEKTFYDYSNPKK